MLHSINLFLIYNSLEKFSNNFAVLQIYQDHAFLFCFSVGFDNFDLHLIIFHLFLFRHKNLIETYQPGSRASILPNVNSLIQKIPFQSILRILDIQGQIIYLISGFLRVINILPHRSFKYL